MAKLQQSFYLRSDVLAISRELLGKALLTRLRLPRELATATARHARRDTEVVTGGIIVETEAYAGPEDRASHAYGNRRTKRTEIMFAEGGVAYCYLCYGIHCLFNIVTHRAGVPHAILVRAIEPTHGIEIMLRRRNKKALCRDVAGGPGALTRALGIDTSHNGVRLTGNRIWIEDPGVTVAPSTIEASRRVGVHYAGPDARLPWRFRIRNSPWTSKAR